MQIDKPGIIRHERCNITYTCGEKLNKEDSFNFHFMIIPGRYMAYSLYSNVLFFSPGHLKKSCQNDVSFLLLPDYHKSRILKQHLFIISSFACVRCLSVGAGSSV